MSTALIVVDVQNSFKQRPYWTEQDAPAFVATLQGLIDRSSQRDIPVLQVFHVESQDGPKGPFSMDSGFVSTLDGLRIHPTEVFHKTVHSALFGKTASGQTLEQWLREHRITHVIVTGIRTEQCCETTTRHASDSGFEVTYVMDATLTFPMVSRSGREFSPADIKERTELVLAGRFAQVVDAKAVLV